MKCVVNATSVTVGKPTGIERFALRISQELHGIDKNIEIVSSEVIPGVYSGAMSKTLAIARQILGKYEYLLRALWDQVCFRFLVLKHKPDVIFFPIQDGLLYPPTKQVVTVHDLHYLHFDKSMPECKHEIGPARTRIYLRKMPHILQSSAAVIAVSESTRQDVAAFFNIPLEKIHVVYNGYDEARFQPINNPETVLRRYELRKEGYFLFVGSILPHKNLVRLVQAFAQLDDEIVLVIAGACKDSSHLDEVVACAHELGVSGDRLRYLEYVSDEDLPYLYSGALALVLPSLHEGFGVPIIEAMACGTPVITSNCSAMPEVAGDAALLVDPYSVESMAGCMKKVMESEHIRLGLRQQGLERAVEFRWTTSAAKLYEILQMVISI